jgi:hypothetical protein
LRSRSSSAQLRPRAPVRVSLLEPCEDALTGRRDRLEVAGAEHQLGGNGKVSRPTMSIANPSKLIAVH